MNLLKHARTHTGGKPSVPPDEVFWIKIKKFDERGLLRGHEEFTHPSWPVALGKLAQYLDNMSKDGMRSFEIAIIPSKE